MKFKIFKITISFFAIIIAIFLVYVTLGLYQVEVPASKIIPSQISENSISNTASATEQILPKAAPVPKQVAMSSPAPKIPSPPPIIEVSSKSFEELVNGAVIQLYCGYLSGEGTNYSDISRGSGIIITSKGEILTNRHIIYDENMKKARPDCFVLKSQFPNDKSQNPRIYYAAEIISYPAIEKFGDSFSKDKYYNDFAVLKIVSKPNSESKINLLLGFDYASLDDYSVLENSTSTFNFLPIDWNYQPRDGDILITLGYGVDASRSANKITSTIGKLSGNIDIDKSSKPQILLVESNATAGFSGGALINPQSKGLVGLISWITSGDEAGKYTVAIFRDFLRTLMLQDLGFNLK